MTTPQIQTLAARIAAALFTTAGGTVHADRLQLWKDDKYLAGWAEGPAAKAIEKVIEEMEEKNGRN